MRCKEKSFTLISRIFVEFYPTVRVNITNDSAEKKSINNKIRFWLCGNDTYLETKTFGAFLRIVHSGQGNFKRSSPLKKKFFIKNLLAEDRK